MKLKDTKNSYRAIKIIPKNRVKDPTRFSNEINIMRTLVLKILFFIFNLKIKDHPNIIKLYETFEDSRNVYLVMEY